MKLNKRVVAVMAAAGLLTLSMAGNAMAASDSNPGRNDTLAGTGSDTTDDVVGALAKQLKDGSNNPYLSSYTAVGSATVTTKTGAFANPNCAFTRPDGSGAGINALAQAIQTGIQGPGQSAGQVMDNCVDFARSSSSSAPSVAYPANSLTYVPFAYDALSYATLGTSTVVHNMTLADLKTVYKANGLPGSDDCLNLAPLLPQQNSGTRKFWGKMLGIAYGTATDGALDITKPGTQATDNSWGSCVRDHQSTTGTTDNSGASIQEHVGTAITKGNQLAPFSAAVFISYASGTVPDARGRAVLNSIDFDGATGSTAVSPVLLQTAFKGTTASGVRQVYNVIPTSKTATAPYSTVFVGGSSLICNSTATIQKYGFAPIPATDLSPCGSTTLTR